MKRYILFAGYSYYAGGGANDLVTSCDTEEEAIEIGSRMCDISVEEGDTDWYNIFDTTTLKITHKYGFIYC